MTDDDHDPAGFEPTAGFATTRDHVVDELVRFVRALRRAGATVPANAGTTAARGLAAVGFNDRERAKVALRACLVTEAADRATFDDLFPAFWRRLTAGPEASAATRRFEEEADGGPSSPGSTPLDGSAASGTESEDRADDGHDGERGGTERRGITSHEAETDDEGEGVTTARYSPVGRRTAVTDQGERVDLDDEFRDLTRSLATLPGRRWRSGGDERADVRRAIRASVATGGTVVDVPRRQRKRSGVRGCLLVDVSRSVLDVVDRPFLIEFLRRAREAWREARVFFFDDDLREVSSAFDASTTETASDALSRAETEWGGGTRIGGSLARLHERAPNAVSRRSVVFVVSDGLEMGDVEALEREAAWLSRRAHAVFWLNPLAASPDYEPTARGMAAALPYLDGLFAFAEPADLAEVARQLGRQGRHGRIGYEYDPRRVETTDARRHTS